MYHNKLYLGNCKQQSSWASWKEKGRERKNKGWGERQERWWERERFWERKGESTWGEEEDGDEQQGDVVGVLILWSKSLWILWS